MYQTCLFCVKMLFHSFLCQLKRRKNPFPTGRNVCFEQAPATEICWPRDENTESYYQCKYLVFNALCTASTTSNDMRMLLATLNKLLLRRVHCTSRMPLKAANSMYNGLWFLKTELNVWYRFFPFLFVVNLCIFLYFHQTYKMVEEIQYTVPAYIITYSN